MKERSKEGQSSIAFSLSHSLLITFIRRFDKEDKGREKIRKEGRRQARNEGWKERQKIEESKDNPP
jgi:hypothetical protein